MKIAFVDAISPAKRFSARHCLFIGYCFQYLIFIRRKTLQIGFETITRVTFPMDLWFECDCVRLRVENMNDLMHI